MRIALRPAGFTVLLAAPECAAQVAAAFAAMFLLATASGCATTVKVRCDEGEDFSWFRTWDWLEPGTGEVETPLGPSPRLRAKIAGRIRETLNARGLRYATEGADLRVHFQLRIERRTGVASITPAVESISTFHSSGYYEVQASRRESQIFEVGRLAIVLSDPARGRVVWRGDFVQRLRESFATHVDEALSTLLDRLPPARSFGGVRREIVIPPRVRELASR